MRRLLQIHTAFLAILAIGLLLWPDRFLAGVGVSIPSTFPEVSLTRIIAMLVAVIAAVSSMLVGLAPESQMRALLNMSLAYAAMAAIMLIQDITIWRSGTGIMLVVIPAVFAALFGAAYLSVRRALASDAPR